MRRAMAFAELCVSISMLAFLAASIPVSAGQNPSNASPPSSAAPSGAEVYQKRCATCHEQAGSRAPSRDALQKLSAARILRTLDFGLMMAVAYPINRDEREAVANYLGTKTEEAAAARQRLLRRQRCYSIGPREEHLGGLEPVGFQCAVPNGRGRGSRAGSGFPSEIEVGARISGRRHGVRCAERCQWHAFCWQRQRRCRSHRWKNGMHALGVSSQRTGARGDSSGFQRQLDNAGFYRSDRLGICAGSQIRKAALEKAA